MEYFEENRRHLRRTGESFQFSQSEVPEDVPIADSTSQAADHKECGSSSDSVSPRSAACSSTEPESVSPSSCADPARSVDPAGELKFLRD